MDLSFGLNMGSNIIETAVQYWLDCTTTDSTIYIRLLSAGDQYMATFVGANGVTYQTLTTTLGNAVDVAAQGLTSPYRFKLPMDMGSDQSATSLYIHGNSLEGAIPDFASIGIATFFAYGNKFDSWDGGLIPVSLGTLRLENNLLPQSVVDDILQAVVDGGKVAGTRVLNLGGTGNSAPSAAGLVNVDYLVNTMGWTVTVN
jgi:hypothetical protein